MSLALLTRFACSGAKAEKLAVEKGTLLLTCLVSLRWKGACYRIVSYRIVRSLIKEYADREDRVLHLTACAMHSQGLPPIYNRPVNRMEFPQKCFVKIGGASYRAKAPYCCTGLGRAIARQLAPSHTGRTADLMLRTVDAIFAGLLYIGGLGNALKMWTSCHG